MSLLGDITECATIHKQKAPRTLQPDVLQDGHVGEMREMRISNTRKAGTR